MIVFLTHYVLVIVFIIKFSLIAYLFFMIVSFGTLCVNHYLLTQFMLVVICLYFSDCHADCGNKLKVLGSPI